MSTDEFTTQPNDLLAEQAVVGTMLASADGAARVLALLVATDFYHPAHRTIFDAISTAYEAREPTAMAAVNTRLLNNGSHTAVGGGPYLLQLWERAVGASELAYLASQVGELAMARALNSAGERIAQRALAADGTSAEEKVGWAVEQIAAVRSGTGEAGEDGGLGEEELMLAPAKPTWLIPGLLERGDRLMLTGAEGQGKSTLTRQLAVMAAAGIHPFNFTRFDGVKVMVVDCENGTELNRRRYNPLLKQARDDHAPTGGNFRLYPQTHGLDLTQRGGAGWLLRRMERNRPDLLVIGPLYRLHFGDPNDERDARRVSANLDRCREVSGAGLILEAHSPHGMAGRVRTLRPVGSSLWMRWPEFGYGLEGLDDAASRMFRVSKLKAWRGPRDERSWPRQVRVGLPWPWVDDTPPHWDAL